MNRLIADGPATSDSATLGDALAFLRRRIWVCLAIAGLLLAGSILLAFKLPPVYLSRATLLIEQPAIPQDIIPSTIQSYVDEQIQIVSQRVYTPDSVMAIVEKFDLYPDERKAEDEALTVERFIAETYAENLTADVTDDRGRAQASTFAFIIGFQHNDPATAQNVAAELADRFIAENMQSRQERATTTTDFLEQEADRLAAEIAELETRIAEFKDQYGDALPDQVTYSMTVLTRSEDEINRTQEELRQLRAERSIIEAEMRTLDPHATVFSSTGEAVLSADQRLAELRAQYLELSSRYGAEHPDVVRTKREIEAIVGTGGAAGALGSVAEQRASLEAERDALIERYSPEHPDVVRLQRAIDALPAEGSVAATSPRRGNAPSNPAYLQAQARLQSTIVGIASAERRLAELSSRRTGLETNIAMAPRIEQDWLQLNRGYESLRTEYEEIKRRSTSARLSESLEAQNKGERFTILRRAGLPSEPVEPNRPAIIFLGAVLALGAGIGVAALIDAMDSTVRGAQDMLATIGQKPLVSIPYVRTSHDRRMAWTWRFAATGMTIAFVGALFALI